MLIPPDLHEVLPLPGPLGFLWAGWGWAGHGAEQDWPGAAAAQLWSAGAHRVLKPLLAAGWDFTGISECRVLHTNPDWQLELGGFQHGVADFSGVKQCPSVSGLPLQRQ